MHSSRMRTARLLTISHHALRGGVSDPPREQNDWQTGVKTLPCRNFFAGGDNGNKILQREDTTDDKAESDMCLIRSIITFPV